MSLCIPPPPPPQVNFWFKRIHPTPLSSDPQLFLLIITTIKKESKVLLFFIFFVLSPFLCHIVKFFFCHFWFMHFDEHLYHLFVKESSICFPSKRKSGEVPCRHHVFLTKRSHVASFPSLFGFFFWIDKDFWFQSSPFSPFSPLSPLSLHLSSFILCIFGIERLGEKERESH